MSIKKIKDLIYDTNDIIIALVILIIAAAIIAWRMNAIMEYPSQLFTATSDSSSQLTASDASSTDDEADAADDETDIEDSGSDAVSENSLWSDGVLTADVSVTVSGSTASAAIECLVAAGLFDDYAEYQSICDDAGLNHEKVSGGVFTFAAGSTKEDVAKAINWS